MREIRFRAWDNELGVMSYHPNIIRNDNDEVIANAYDIHEDCYELELMQYTGLKDKNGKEIYEGDIVHGKDFNGKVVWDNVMASFKVHRFDADGEVEEYIFLCEYDIKVIGNIYENPELLEEQQ